MPFNPDSYRESEQRALQGRCKALDIIMDDFLTRLKLKHTIAIDLPITKSEFVERFKKVVDHGTLDPFSEIFDVFSRSKNIYKGSVSLDRFRIKRKRKFFDMHMNLAIAEGRFDSKNDAVKITGIINGFRGMMLPFFIFIIAVYLFIFLMIFFSESWNDFPFEMIPFILIHATFMLGIPYAMMRGSAKNLKHDLEREFYFLTRDTK